MYNNCDLKGYLLHCYRVYRAYLSVQLVVTLGNHASMDATEPNVCQACGDVTLG